MDVTHVVGIDPGLVHTGIVRMAFLPADREVWVSHAALTGADPDMVRWAVLGDDMLHPISPRIFIEAYRSRSHFNTDAKMSAAVRDIQLALPGSKVLDNTGVKKIVKPAFMQRLKVWQFVTPTHHQDLRSAARIGLLGMFKDAELNKLLADFIIDHINGKDWDVRLK